LLFFERRNKKNNLVIPNNINKSPRSPVAELLIDRSNATRKKICRDTVECQNTVALTILESIGKNSRYFHLQNLKNKGKFGKTIAGLPFLENMTQ
jgi:hypothetical protein